MNVSERTVQSVKVVVDSVAYRHGLHTAEAVAERRAVEELLRRARAGVDGR
jgi:hypothetical protein